jgi:DNA polymerase-1
VVGAPVNLDSHMQVQKVIFGFLGLPIIFNKKGKVSVDKDILNRLLKKHPDQVIIKDILRHKKLSKLVSTYTELEAELDDRIRTAYGWVSSFRLNSTESHFGSGGNLQNIPVRTEEGLEIRKLFIPDPGMVLLAADLVQAEAMEVAWLSDDQELIEAFLARVDVHWENAKRIFKLPLNVEYNKTEPVLIRYFDEPILMKKLRDIAKTVVHAGNYGMGPYKLQSILILQGIWLELGLCKLLIEEAARARPLRTVWQQRTAEEVRIGRVLYNCFNDRKEFRGRVSSSLYNSAYSFRPQSVVGRILQFGIQTISEEVELFEPLLNVHDEVVGQCRPEDIEQVKPQIEKALMITHVPNSATGKELTIPCDFKVGPSWGEMREIK